MNVEREIVQYLLKALKIPGLIELDSEREKYETFLTALATATGIFFSCMVKSKDAYLIEIDNYYENLKSRYICTDGIKEH